MSFQTPTQRAISVAVFFGLTLAAPSRGPESGAALADDSEPHGAATVVASTNALASTSATAKSVKRIKNVERPEPSAAPPEAAPCAAGMTLIEGEYCPEAEQVCLRWLDPPPYQNLRCGEYAKPATCTGPRQPRRFCIDREEFADNPSAAIPANDALPMVNTSWTQARSLCEKRGARLCKETEWEFACEGPDMSPYPYGFERKPGTCNHDRTDLGGAQDKLRDHRAPVSAFAECMSPFGVHHMTGNVDEWVEREHASAPNRSALRGGWWLPGRNRCRAATVHHGEAYSAKQVGFRCCSDAT